jgi:hypothetical protein
MTAAQVVERRPARVVRGSDKAMKVPLLLLLPRTLKKRPIVGESRMA